MKDLLNADSNQSIPRNDGESKANGESTAAEQPFQSRYNGHDPQTLKTADRFMAWGVDWLYYDDRSKNPNNRGLKWQTLPTPSREEAERILRGGEHNIGAHLRNGLADLDLDTLEAVRVARHMYATGRLPHTGMIWGRAGKPRSHYLYWLTRTLEKAKHVWEDPTPANGLGKKLLEFRVKGQTVAPGSRHDKTGELIEWEPDGDGPPSPADPAALQPRLDWAAAASLVARYWHSGDRHDMALPLAGLLYHGGMTQDDALLFMEEVCYAAEDIAEIENRLNCVRDTYRNGDQHGANITGGPTLVIEDYLTPQQVRRVREWLGLKAQSTTSADLLGPDLIPLTGNGDGERFAAMWAGQVLYCAAQDSWYIWDGRRFALDDVSEIRERAKKVVAEFRRVLGEKQSNCGRGGIAPYRDCSKHAVDMDSPGAITAMLSAARSKPDIRVAAAQLDSHPGYLNVLNGTLEFDLTDGSVRFHEHRPEDWLTLLAPVVYVSNATHDLIDEYLALFFPEGERRTFLMRLAGDALHGYPKRHAMNLVGPTNSGKSMTLKLFAAVLGEYASTLEYTSLMRNPHKGGDTPRADLWRVRRKRLLTVAEVPPDATLDVALIKSMLSGGDAMPVRNLFDKSGGEEVQWATSLWMSGNKPYGPPPSEEAAYERLHVIRGDHQVERSQRDDVKMRETLDPAVTGSAVLAFMVEGFKLLYGQDKGRLVEPESSVQAKRELRNSLDDKWSDLIERLFVITRDSTDGVKRSEAWDLARSELYAAGEVVNKPRLLQKQFEEALEWRSGSAHTHSESRWRGAARYWPGVKWSEYALESYVRSISPPDW